jgi:hypothetical protein
LVSVRWAENVALWGEENCRENCGGRPDGKRPLGRHRNKWKDKVKEEFGNMTEWP